MKKEILTKKEIKLLRILQNSLVHNGKIPTFRRQMTLMGYRSTRSVLLLYDSLIAKKFLKRISHGSYEIIRVIPKSKDNAGTIDVPLVKDNTGGLQLLNTENTETVYSISTSLAKPPFKYFLLRASGKPMDMKGIQNGDILLIRRQETAKNGDTVVAVINDETTLREFRRVKNYIVLQPHSSDPEYKPIILTEDFMIQGIMVAVLPEISV